MISLPARQVTGFSLTSVITILMTAAEAADKPFHSMMQFAIFHGFHAKRLDSTVPIFPLDVP